MHKRVFFNALSALAFGAFYGYFDYSLQASTHFTFMDLLFPWIMMFGMFILPNILIDYNHIFIGMGNAAIALSTEDAMYWFWAHTWPTSWAWFYPVVYHVPMIDVLGYAIGIIFYLIHIEKIENKIKRSPRLT